MARTKTLTYLYEKTDGFIKKKNLKQVRNVVWNPNISSNVNVEVSIVKKTNN